MNPKADIAAATRMLPLVQHRYPTAVDHLTDSPIRSSTGGGGSQPKGPHGDPTATTHLHTDPRLRDMNRAIRDMRIAIETALDAIDAGCPATIHGPCWVCGKGTPTQRLVSEGESKGLCLKCHPRWRKARHRGVDHETWRREQRARRTGQ